MDLYKLYAFHISFQLIAIQETMKGIGVTAFQIAPAVIEYGKTVTINAGAQLAGYAIGAAVGTDLSSNMLLPLFTNPEFLKQQIIAAPTLTQKIAIIASSGSLFMAGGIVSFTADIATNAGIGSVIASYLNCLQSTGGTGTTPFIAPTAHTDMMIVHTFVLTIAIGFTTLTVKIIIYLIRSYIRLCVHCYKITRGVEVLSPEEYNKRLKKSQVIKRLKKSYTFPSITDPSTAPVRRKIVKSVLFGNNAKKSN